METTYKRLLDRIRACTELAEVTQFAFRAVAEHCKHFHAHRATTSADSVGT